jgi:hypothetical protein
MIEFVVFLVGLENFGSGLVAYSNILPDDVVSGRITKRRELGRLKMMRVKCDSDESQGVKDDDDETYMRIRPL